MYVRLRTTELHTVLVHYSLSENLAVASPIQSGGGAFLASFCACQLPDMPAARQAAMN